MPHSTVSGDDGEHVSPIAAASPICAGSHRFENAQYRSASQPDSGVRKSHTRAHSPGVPVHTAPATHSVEMSRGVQASPTCPAPVA
ncbi:MAG: hypothetical protein IPG04_41890 [Polyangiaceae bacterium]|nr:hypothetical protein [Polyangiaceae bacterium]